MSEFYQELKVILLKLDQRISIVHDNVVGMFSRAVEDGEPDSRLISLSTIKDSTAMLSEKLAELQQKFDEVFNNPDFQNVVYNYDDIMQQFNEYQAWFNEYF